MSKRLLRIGYIMQAEAVDMSQPSGPQSHVRAVFQGFQKRGHKVRMVAIQNNRTLWTDNLVSWYPPTYKFTKTPTFQIIESTMRGIQGRLRLPFVRLFDSLKFSDGITSALEEYDILYERFGTLCYGGLIAARRLHIPCILEINGDLIEEYKYFGIKFSQTQKIAINLITPMILKNADHVICVGETIKKRILNRWNIEPSQISVVPNGADVDLFTTLIEPDGIRSRYSINNGPLIIFVGSFQPWHGIDLILEAFSKLLLQKPEAKMVLIGDGKLKGELQAKAHSLRLGNHVVFVGSVEHREVASLLRISDVAVIYHKLSASEIVETPLKLFEYMAAGKAIVAPAVPNMQRLLIDRETALLVPPDNPDALASAFVELLENDQLRMRLGQNARQEAIVKHSWSRVVTDLEDIMSNFIDKKDARSGE